MTTAYPVAVSRVDELLAELHETRANLLAELEIIERALLAFEVREPQRPDRFTTGAQAAILATLRLRGGEAADIAEILAGARALGWSSTSGRPRNVIASTVSKLARAGALDRIGEGRYRLAVVNTDMELEIA